MAEPKKAERFSPAPLTRLVGEYRVAWKLTAFAVVVSVLMSIAELLPPYFGRNAINYLSDWVEAGATGPVHVGPFVVAIVAAAVAQNLLRFTQIMSRTELSVRVTNRLRERLYAAVQRHSLSYHKKTTTGDLIARSTRDIQSITRFIGFGAFMVADMVIFLGGSILILATINPLFTVIALSPVPLALFVTVRSGARLRGKWRDATDTYGEVTTVLQENIAGARVVRAFAQQKRERNKFAEQANAYWRKAVHAVDYWTTRMIRARFLFSMVTPLGLAYGSYAAIQGNMEVGDLVLCFFYMRPIQHRLLQIMQLVSVYQGAVAGSERVFEILDEEPSIRTHPGARPMPVSDHGGAEVAFRDVSFAYEPGKPTIEGLTFTARPGQTVAIVGHTGSGKSTLISLIPRFHDVTAGAVTVGGVDVRDLDLRSLRQAIGIIFQETFLFSATVRENIAYGRPEAGFEEIQAAAEAARAHDFIVKFEHGYDTVVGERGVTLSGGQAQRLAIARAVLLDPQVLIMDDATASVDSETERQIRETMRRVAEGRTNFIVGHRVSSVAHADVILVLKDGRIVERGAHAELFERGGIYRRMCDQQFAGQPNE